MRTDDIDILMVPGWTGSGPDHWQSRWEQRLKTARRVALPHVDRPERGAWVEAIVAAAEAARRPVVLVAHSCGVHGVVHAAPRLAGGATIGAMLVAPPDLENDGPLSAFVRLAGSNLAVPAGFLPLPNDPLPFPSLLIAGRNDPYCSYDKAGEMALAWGSALVDAGESGHINTESGHGPWPEGALKFGTFLRQIGPLPREG